MRSGHDIIAGYYGFGNFGDDVFRDTLGMALEKSPWARPVINQNQWGSGASAKVARNLHAITNLLRARSITLGGGSILGARGKLGIRQIEMAIARTKGLPYCAIGVGLLEGASGGLEGMIAQMSWIGLRSEGEYNELRGSHSNVHYMSDLAYAAPHFLDIDVGKQGQGGDIAIVAAGVGELGHASVDGDWLGGWLRTAVLPMLHGARGVKLLRLQPANAGDAAATERLARAIRALGVETRIVTHERVTDTVAEIASSSFLFTDRLHGAILAHICGVPFRLSKHHKKCHDLLHELGHPDADSGRSIVSASVPSDLSAWMAAEEANVTRHSQLATSGVEDWLDHLRKRSN